MQSVGDLERKAILDKIALVFNLGKRGPGGIVQGYNLQAWLRPVKGTGSEEANLEPPSCW